MTGATVHALFEARVEATPNAIAIESRGDRITYGQLDGWANRIANYLVSRGIPSEAVVGVCLERSPVLVATLLATLKAGCAYLPLDPSYPASRLSYMVADSGTRLVVTASSLAAWIGERGESVLEIDTEASTIEGMSSAPPRRIDSPRAVTYAMYTSGSTGMPKAVLVEHRNVVNLCTTIDYVTLDAQQCVLHLSPASFDAATFEIWGTLLNGGRLAIAPPGHLSTSELGAILADRRVTVLWLTAALFQRVVDDDVSALDPVAQLLSGGDVLSADHVARTLLARPGRTFVNGYGPTETTTFACCHVMRDVGDVESPVPIGRPLANVRVHIVRKSHCVSTGTPGEIWIAGAGVSRGYLNRRALTAERFVPEPTAMGTSRAYRTGDLGLLRSNGVVEFLGRMDDQIKIRGFRVEPAEIEVALASHSGVRRAVVVARTAPPGDKRLVAYLVLQVREVPELRALRHSLSALLPSHMIPAVFIAIPDVPITPNGKIDREALPDPDWSKADRLQMPA